MTDKERILTNFIGRLYFGRDHALEIDVKPSVGDLVYLNFFSASDWSLGWLDSFHETDGYYIREIGSNRLCHCYNCTPIKVKIIDSTLFLEGKQNLFYEKIVKVFRREYYITRISGLSFEGRKAYLEIREKWSEEEPLTVELHMSMSMKKITEAIGPDGSQFKTSIKKEEK